MLMDIKLLQNMLQSFGHIENPFSIAIDMKHEFYEIRRRPVEPVTVVQLEYLCISLNIIIYSIPNIWIQIK